ncbi:MAG TPA: SDR family oxidoreductase [Gammaproteobacteria bacterium]|nr:SDR family oxidoreductase [Gammaproteobacteria bacterium]
MAGIGQFQDFLGQESLAGGLFSSRLAGMKGKVCVITGGTDGIGKAAAYGLATRGARLIVHGRDPEKGARAVAELKARSGNPAIEFLAADFGSLAEVRGLAAAVLERAPRIDVLVNNAGSIFVKRAVSKDGYEMTFAVNHLAPFLLTHLLQGALQRGAPSRIVTTASNAHLRAKIPFDDLQLTRKYSPMGAYGISKLANILFTRALARRLEGTAVSATCLHPGFVRTNFGANNNKDMSPISKYIFLLVSRFARTPERGAETVIHLAASPEVHGESGGYYFDCKPLAPSPAGQDDDAAERLWQLSEQLVGIA